MRYMSGHFPLHYKYGIVKPGAAMQYKYRIELCRVQISFLDAGTSCMYLKNNYSERDFWGQTEPIEAYRGIENLDARKEVVHEAHQTEAVELWAIRQEKIQERCQRELQVRMSNLKENPSQVVECTMTLESMHA